jgi:hypothetical protein
MQRCPRLWMLLIQKEVDGVLGRDTFDAEFARLLHLGHFRQVQIHRIQ